MMPFIYKGKDLSFLVSPHRDGQIVGKALTRFGFHAILGSIFEKRQQWGDSYNPSSAVFQWEHALQAYHRLQTSEPANYTRVPGLHERLATAYQAVGRSKDAYAQWITAAEGFSGLQQYQGAQKAIQRADLLPAPSDNNLRIKRQQILNSIPAAP